MARRGLGAAQGPGRVTKGQWRGLIGLSVVVVAIAGWEILSRLTTGKGSHGEALIPSWEYVFGSALKRMSDYWTGGFGVPVPSEGGKETYAGAFLAIGRSSLITGERVFGGLLLGCLVGSALGLAVSASRWTRRLFAGPAHVLRMAPLLAMIPLFALWFGATTEGMVIFVAYGVAVVLFIGVLNAVGNILPVYFDRAATLGASRLTIYRTVVIPAIFPELRSSILLSLGLAWSLVLGAELLGADAGLGVILLYAEQFAYVGRMIIVAMVIVLYAGGSFALFEIVSRRLISWHPRSTRVVATKVEP